MCSSDIDLIFIYELDGMTLDGRKSISHHEWFDRQGKRIIRYLSEITPQGFVFSSRYALKTKWRLWPLSM
jgi:glutamate-ammonia-ligase adenylyltransferase